MCDFNGFYVMKARVKATGEIVEVMYSHTANDKGCDIVWYITPRGPSFSKEELEFIDTGESLDYWTRLEHQAAIAAMQGMLSNPEVDLDYKSDECMPQALAATAYNIAHALVEKMKEADR